MERCYPCAIAAHPCMAGATWRPGSGRCEGVPAQAGLRWFGVALWYEETSLFPEQIGSVQEAHAFSAVEVLMRHVQRMSVARATAIAFDRSVCYRAWRVDLDVEVCV